MNESAKAVRRAQAKGEVWRWLLGAAITLLVVGGVAATLFAMPNAASANRRACMTARANDLHADLAAFAQDPAWQGDYVDALAACVR